MSDDGATDRPEEADTARPGRSGPSEDRTTRPGRTGPSAARTARTAGPDSPGRPFRTAQVISAAGLAAAVIALVVVSSALLSRSRKLEILREELRALGTAPAVPGGRDRREVGKRPGLLARFYGNVDLEGPHVHEVPGVPDIKDYSVPGVGAENWSVRYAGEVRVPADGDYRFAAIADDGVRLRVAGTELVGDEAWKLQFPTRYDGRIRLRAGWHPIELAMFQGPGGSRLWLGIGKGDGEPETVTMEMLRHGVGPEAVRGTAGRIAEIEKALRRPEAALEEMGGAAPFGPAPEIESALLELEKVAGLASAPANARGFLGQRRTHHARTMTEFRRQHDMEQERTRKQYEAARTGQEQRRDNRRKWIEREREMIRKATVRFVEEVLRKAREAEQRKDWKVALACHRDVAGLQIPGLEEMASESRKKLPEIERRMKEAARAAKDAPKDRPEPPVPAPEVF